MTAAKATRYRAPAILKVESLSVRRGDTVILDKVSWEIRPRQHWVILGANGSGKTSLLSALTGYLMPTQGKVNILGHEYGRKDWRELRKQIGLVSSSIRQMMADGESALETVVSGKYAMIDFWGRMTAADRRRGGRLLDLIECRYLAQRAWLHLSQGERQRIMIGRALMANPKLLILDEPCAGLDPAAREHFLQFLQRLGKEKSGPTLVLVTHHVEEIVPVFSHVMVLRAGRILQAGPRAQTLTSMLLSQAFASSMRLLERNGRYELRVSRSKGVVL